MRAKYATILLGLASYVSAAALLLLGVVKTTAEMGEGNLWFARIVPITVVIAVIVWVFNIKKLKVGIVDLAVIMNSVWYVVCYIVSDSVAISKILENALFFAIYVALRIFLSSYRGMAVWLFVVLCACGVIEGIEGIGQAFDLNTSGHALFSVTGTFFNPGPYGGYLAVVVSLAAGYIATRYKYAEKVFAGFRNPRRLTISHILWITPFFVAVLAAIIGMVILPSTMSRAAMLAIGAAIIAIITLDTKLRDYLTDYVRRHRTKSAIIVISTVIVVASVLFGIYCLKKDSADGRLLIWKTAAKVMLAHPLTGTGPGYYHGAYGDVQAEYFSESRNISEAEIKVAGSPEYGFNEFLYTGAETGVTGLLLFLFLATTVLWVLFRHRNYYGFGFLALLVFAFFSYPFALLPLKTMLILFVAVAGYYASTRKEASVALRVIAGIGIGAGVCAVALATRPYMDRVEASRKWQDERRWYSMELYGDVVEEYSKLAPLLEDNAVFLFEYGRSLYLEGRLNESLAVLEPATKLSCDPMYYNVIGNCYKVMGEYDRAGQAYLKAYHIVPHKMYPLYLLAKMYGETGDYGKAIDYAERVVGMTPKIPSPATHDMQKEMKELIVTINNL
jgi:O-antigen ligase